MSCTGGVAPAGYARFPPSFITGVALRIIHMTDRLVLASGSEIRAQLLRQAGLDPLIHPVRIDEETIRAALVAEGATPRDIADTLAEMKAQKAAARYPGDLVLGCDQVLDDGGTVLGKPRDREEIAAQIRRLSGKTHKLLSALVIYEDGKPVWRHVGVARLTMGRPSAAYLDAYLDRNGDSLLSSVGGYKLEEEGVRLFTRVDGDYFTILGLPLLDLLSYLKLRGTVPT